jgi:microcystin-dependent protein
LTKSVTTTSRTDLKYGVTYKVVFVANDISGNSSAASAPTLISPAFVTAPDMSAGSVTANSIAVGSLDAFMITSPLIRSSAPASGMSRYEEDSYGIHFYNASGAATIDLDASSGNALITGILRTGPTGTQRVELNSALWANGYTGIRLYDTSGNTGWAELKASNTGAVYLTSGEVVTSSSGHSEIYMDQASWAMGGAFKSNTGAVQSHIALDGQIGARLIGVCNSTVTGVISVYGHLVADSMEFSRFVAPDSASAGLWLTQAGDMTMPVKSLVISSHASGSVASVTINGNLSVTGSAPGAPTGAQMEWYTATAPTGWVIADGSAVSRTGTYAALFAVIGTIGGPGDGSTTFNLPDMRGRVAVGYKSADANFGTLGAAVGAATVASAAHTHTSAAHTHTSAAHAHDLSDAGQAAVVASAATPTFAMRRIAATWTATHQATGLGVSASTAAQTLGAGLAGSTDSFTPGATGSTTPAATGSTSPAATSVIQPSLTINFIIKL